MLYLILASRGIVDDDAHATDEVPEWGMQGVFHTSYTMAATLFLFEHVLSSASTLERQLRLDVQLYTPCALYDRSMHVATQLFNHLLNKLQSLPHAWDIVHISLHTNPAHQSMWQWMIHMPAWRGGRRGSCITQAWNKLDEYMTTRCNAWMAPPLLRSAFITHRDCRRQSALPSWRPP